MSRIALVCIHIFLAIQIGLACRYYFGGGDERDERFAWRMFSPIRMERCRAQFFEGESTTPLKTGAVFHEAWTTLASRGRIQVLRSMANHLCQKTEFSDIRVRTTCQSISGEKQNISEGHFNSCVTGSIR